MNRKWKISLRFMMPFLTLATGFCTKKWFQDVLSNRIQRRSLTGQTLMTQGAEAALKQVKFRDNWFCRIAGRRPLFLGTHAGRFFDQVPSRRCVVHRHGSLLGRRYPPPRFLWKQCRTASNDKPFYPGRHGGRPGTGLFQLHQPLLRVKGRPDLQPDRYLGSRFTNTPPTSAGVPGTTECTIPNRKTWLSIRLGLMAKFRLGKAWDFNLEITNSLFDDSFWRLGRRRFETTAGWPCQHTGRCQLPFQKS